MRPLANRFSIVPLLLAFAASPAMSQSEGMPWRSDFKAAQAEAQQTGKLVLVHFWTESCGPCKLLEKRVFSQPQVGLAISNEYVPVKVNANESPELAQAYGVTRVPTDAVVTAEGQLVKTFISPATPMEYVGYVTQLAGAYRSQVGGYTAAVAAAPAPSSTKAGPQSAPATTATNPYAAIAGGTAPTAPASPVAGNPYALASTQQPLPPQQTDNRYADAPSVPIAPKTPAPVAPSPQVVAEAAVQLPPGSPPLGFEGFCPVTMKSDWRWQKGDAKWGAIHRGRTYLFASEQAQQMFLANPDAYSPVLSGADPVAAVDQRRSVPGVREYAVEFEGRFYLFSNEQTLEKFWSDPAAYAQGVQRVAALPSESSFIR